MTNIVYMDNNATTMVAPEVVDEMLPFFTQRYGNPSSIHAFGGEVAKDLAIAKEKVASLLGVAPAEIVCNSCGTESDSTAILSALRTNSQRREIVTTRVEHPAVMNLCKQLAMKQGFKVHWLSVDKSGLLDLEEAKEVISEKTAIVSVMWANNETGVVYPVHEIAEIAHEKGALFHTDAVQAVGKIPLELDKAPIDFLSLSGHKLHAPKGVGALYIRRGTEFEPFLVGGHQERGRRGGTENVPYVIGFGKAAELAALHFDHESEKIKKMRDRLEEGLMKAIPSARINGAPDSRLPNTLNIAFEYVEGEAILMRLDDKGICASSGSACTSGSLEPSHVLRAMGVPFTCVHGSIRFSLSRYNTMEEVEYVIREAPKVIETLRAMSPFGPDNFNTACTIQ